MRKSLLRNSGVFQKLSTGILLAIYLSIYPSILYCDIICERANNSGKEGLDVSYTSSGHNHIHEHDHHGHSVYPSHYPVLNKDKSGEHKYSFCLFVHPIPVSGISANPLQITGVFEVAEKAVFYQGDDLQQIFCTSISSRAPPSV